MNVATYGPVSVGINSTPKSFKFYRGGIYDDLNCGKSDSCKEWRTIDCKGLDNCNAKWLATRNIPRRSFTFFFPTVDNIASKFPLRFGRYAPVLFLTSTSALFFVLSSGCPTFLSSMTGLPRLWDLVLFTVLSVNDVVSCMLARWVGFSTHEFQSTSISALTGKKRVNPPPTSILSHHCHTHTGHPVSPDDFTILSSSSFNSELVVRESLLIRKPNPRLNANTGSFPLSLF